MKYKILILIICLFSISFIYIIHPYIEETSTDGFKKDIIRFHIRANSDLKEDQDLKLKIRDEVLKVMNEKFKSTKSIGESRALILENLEEIKNISQSTLASLGKDYDIKVSLKQDDFPTRKYGKYVLPQGEYETLLIEIGEAQGQNWWCIMYPPLCFVDITHSVALDTSELDLEGLGEFIIDENQPIKVKSIIAEWLEKIL